jgi:hypothetical protein
MHVRDKLTRGKRVRALFLITAGEIRGTLSTNYTYCQAMGRLGKGGTVTALISDLSETPIARIMGEPPVATAIMAILPGVLGSSFDRLPATSSGQAG